MISLLFIVELLSTLNIHSTSSYYDVGDGVVYKQNYNDGPFGINGTTLTSSGGDQPSIAKGTFNFTTETATAATIAEIATSSLSSTTRDTMTAKTSASSVTQAGTTTATTEDLPSTPVYDGTIVIHVGGELGNHLSALAHGKGLQLRLYEKYGIFVNLIMKQSSKKGKHYSTKRTTTKNIIKECFPNIVPLLRNNKRLTEELEAKQTLQYSNWLTQEQSNILKQSINGNRGSDGNVPNDIYQAMFDDVGRKQLDESLDLFHQLVLERKNTIGKRLEDMTNTANNKDDKHVSRSIIHLPFLESRTIASDYMTNLYYQQIHDFFQLNETNPICCNKIPTKEDDSGNIVLVRLFLYLSSYCFLLIVWLFSLFVFVLERISFTSVSRPLCLLIIFVNLNAYILVALSKFQSRNWQSSSRNERVRRT